MKIIFTLLLCLISVFPIMAQKPGKNTSASSDAAYIRKLNAITSFYNTFGARIGSLAKDYFEHVDPEKGVTGKEDDYYGFTDGEGYYDSEVRALENAAKSAPLIPDLDRAILACVGPLKAIRENLFKAQEYYKKTRLFELDKFEKGKLWHPVFVKGFNDFIEAKKNLYPLYNAEMEKYADIELNKILKKYGNGFVFLHHKAANYGERAIKTATAEQFDEALFKKQAAAFIAVYKELDEYSRLNSAKLTKNQKEYYRVVTQSSMSGYNDNLKLMLDDFEYGKVDDDKLNNSLNYLVDSYNNYVKKMNTYQSMLY